MAPEVVGPFALQGGVKEEVLQLRKGEKRGGFDDRNIVESSQAFVVQVEGVLKSEARIAVGELCSAVIDNKYLIRRPPGSDPGNDSLLQQRPVAGEGDEERRARRFEV